MANSGCFGIHLGNTNGCIALYKEKFDVIANEGGDFVTPATLAIIDDGSHVVGLAAKQQLSRYAQACAINPIHVLSYGTNSDEELSQDILKQCGTNIKNIRGECLYVLKRGDTSRELSALFVIEELFKNLNSIANHAIQLAKCSVVISVPHNMSQITRKSIFLAAQNAGFRVLQIISNPSAAVLAYDLLNNTSEERNVLVYRLGGISADVTLLRISDGFLSILHSVAENDLGGKLLTEVLVRYISKEFEQKYKLNPNESRKTISKLFQYAENTKHILSSMQSAHIFIESLMDGIDFSHTLSRARYESIFASTISLYKKPIEKLLNELKFDSSNINQIILCGGGMKVPKVRAEISNMFPGAQVLSGINEDEILAIGGAKQAAITVKQWDLQQEFFEMQLNILSVDIILKTNNDQKEIEIFKAGCVIPTCAKFNVELKDKAATFNVYEKPSVGNLTQVGQITINDIVNDSESELVEFCARLNVKGIEINVI